LLQQDSSIPIPAMQTRRHAVPEAGTHATPAIDDRLSSVREAVAEALKRAAAIPYL